MWILWTIVIGFIAGVLAKFVTPGDTHEPQGFILTTLLGIAGAFVMTYLGQALGWYQEGQSTGFIGATLGAILILLVWGFIASRRQLLNSLSVVALGGRAEVSQATGRGFNPHRPLQSPSRVFNNPRNRGTSAVSRIGA